MRLDGYLPIRDYALIGDGRTAALVGRDGAIDWLCLPDLDSPSVFGAVLDAGRGGVFTLAPAGHFGTERRYLPGTNVLETTFRTDDGRLRVVDAMTLPRAGLEPYRELVRLVEGLEGTVELAWRVEPRFRYGQRPGSLRLRGGTAVAVDRADALAVHAWDAGEPRLRDGAVGGSVRVGAGDRPLLAVTAARREPLVLPAREDVERRLEETTAYWREWSERASYEGRWREAVVRSALALKLLVFAPSGAIAAAPTAALPEDLGGERNWDYRYSWIRDCAFTVDAFLFLDYAEEADAFFWWLMHASQLSHPELRVLYLLAGGSGTRERELALEGYRGSRPVYVGNGARDQLQLGIYGTVLEMVRLYVERGNELDEDTGRRVADLADTVCDLWRERDRGIWEVRGEPQHFTHSKLMCWVALDRAVKLAQHHIPGVHARRWREERDAVEGFLEEECWSAEVGAYVRAPGGRDLDASVVMAAFLDYPHRERLSATVDAVRRELADGPVLRRYQGEDGLAGDEGAFLPCSFWLVHALARLGRLDEAEALMDELVGLANDVGLYAEEIDAAGGSFLGNFPQGLTHLALVSAAAVYERERAG